MRVPCVPVLAALLAASLSQAQYLINELSFGYAGRLSPSDANGKIPNFSLQGSPQTPDVLSNKVVLTPVSPGNQRGAVWAEKPLTQQTWVADVDFRANGPERGGGNLNIWLANGGEREIGSSSIYTVGRFEGLALVIDTHGGSAGMIRGFLNDGSMDYSQHHAIDELAFGHCLYPYRNLGRPSQIKLRQTSDVFKVEIDGRLCFESDKFILPDGYFFGITAATPDSPDSFEVFKMVVMSDTTQPAGKAPSSKPVIPKTGSSKPYAYDKTRDKVEDMEDFPDSDIPDEDADVFQTSRMQFQDLHNRLQSSTHQLSATFRAVSKHHQMDEKRHAEIKELFAELKEELASRNDQQAELQKRVKDLEKEVRGMRNDLGKKIQANERTFKSTLTDHHANLSQAMLESVPGHGKLIFILIGTQVVLAVAYVGYKRRKASMPKKYL